MALQLHFSSDLSSLFAAAAEKVRTAWSDPLDAPLVVFPDTKMEQWFRLQWLKRYGVLANLKVAPLERNLWNALQPDPDMEMLSGGVLAAAVQAALKLALARPPAPSSPDDALPETLRRFLTAGSESGQDANPHRLRALSTQIANLFIEYEYSRPALPSIPGLLDRWPEQRFFTEAQGADGKPLPEDEIEIWQRTLYGRIFSPGGLLAQAEAARAEALHLPPRRRLTLPQLYRLHRERLRAEAACPLFIFGLSGIGQFHRVLIHEIAQTQRVDVYLLNPCREYWEDIYQERDETVPEILRLWGRAGCENIKLWCAAAEYNSETLEDEETSPQRQRAAVPVLRQVQRAILDLQPPAAARKPAADHSLTITPAPTELREVEYLRAAVWRDLQEDPALRLDDIIVWCPDLERYRPAITRVFDGVAPGAPDYLPYTIADYADTPTEFQEGMAAFAAMVGGGEINRRLLLTFLRNPLVQQARRFTAEEAAVWADWIAALNLYREKDLPSPHGWAHGMRRLLLGRLMNAPWTTVADAYSATAAPDASAALTIHPYCDIDTADDALLEKFCANIEALRQQVVFFRRPHPPEELLLRLEEFCHQWLAPGDDPRENLVWENALAALGLLRWQVWAGCPNISFSEGAAALMSGGDLPGKASFLTAGLVFARLRPGRALPLRHIYLLGMNESDFPVAGPRDTLDLRMPAAGRRPRWPGDVDSLQQGKYAFLEQLVSARSALHISYLAHDIKKDRPLAPAGVVSELGDYLQRFFGAQLSKKADSVPEYSLEDYLLCINAGKTPRMLTFAPTALERTYRLQPATAEFTPAPAEILTIPEEISVSRLKGFLIDPFSFQLQNALGLKDDAEDPAAAELEPVTNGYLEDASLYAAVLRRVLALPPATWAEADFPEAVNAAALAELRSREETGELPEGIFNRRLRQDFTAWAAARSKELQTILAPAAVCPPVAADRLRLTLPLSSAAGESYKVTVTAEGAVTSDGGEKNGETIIWETAGGSTVADRHFAAGYLTALVIAGSAPAAKSRRYRVCLAAKLPSQDPEMQERVWVFSRSAARKRLTHILTRALVAREAANFPLAFFAYAAKKELPLSRETLLSALADGEFAYFPPAAAALFPLEERLPDTDFADRLAAHQADLEGLIPAADSQ